MVLDDDEISAMQKIAQALTPLDETTRARVLQWAISRFRAGPQQIQSEPTKLSENERSAPTAPPSFDSFAELFESADPSTEREKALVAAYWAQVCQGQPSFGSQTLNDALKDLGHGIGNITDALTALKDDRPALILQLKKSGTSKQARKTYKVTQEGVRRVRGMMLRDNSEAA